MLPSIVRAWSARRSAARLGLLLFASPAAVALALGFLATPAEAQPRGGSDLARARALDKEGARAYGEGRYEDAIRHFEEAYRLGGPPFELWNIAKCYIRLDQLDRAAEHLERYLATPNLPKRDRAEASRQLELIKQRPSALTVSSTPSGARVMIDGRASGRTPVTVTVKPGVHTITVTPDKGAPITRRVQARYGRAITLDVSGPDERPGPDGAAPSDGADEHRPPPPPNPYDTSESGPITLRGAFGVVLPRHGEIGGAASFGLTALGTYRLAKAGSTEIGVGGLVALSGDSWDNRTGQPNEAPGCAPLTDAQSGTALSIFAIASASAPVTSKLRVVGMGGAGAAAYFVDSVGGDLFVPSCRPSPGVRPALLFGARIDYALTSYMRLSAIPLTWQLQPAFDGTRAAPRDASGVWMRFGFGVGAGVDL